jgi:hypothetical protein
MEGIGSFHVHPGHSFGGLVIDEGPPVTVLAVCACGEELCRADGAFIPCPDCAGAEVSCRRCGGSGEVVDHAALQWRAPDRPLKGAVPW